MKDMMGRTQGRELEEQTCIQGFSRKTWRNRPLAVLRRRKENNIKTGIQETGCNGVEQVHPDNHRDKRPALVNTVMEFRVPQNARNFLSSG